MTMTERVSNEQNLMFRSFPGSSQQTGPKEEDEDDLFVKSLVLKMKLLTTIDKIKFQSEVLMTLLKYFERDSASKQVLWFLLFFFFLCFFVCVCVCFFFFFFGQGKQQTGPHQPHNASLLQRFF